MSSVLKAGDVMFEFVEPFPQVTPGVLYRWKMHKGLHQISMYFLGMIEPGLEFFDYLQVEVRGFLRRMKKCL